MRQHRGITPYMASADMSVNCSLSLGKLRGKLSALGVRHSTKYQKRLKHRLAMRNLKNRWGRP